MFWDRKGQPIAETLEWAAKYEDVSYRIVAVDTDGPGYEAPMVSTIWEGINTLGDEVPTRIFDTALVVDGVVQEGWRSDTEEEALITHETVCRIHLGREPRPEDGHVQAIIDNDKKARQSGD